MAVEHLADHGVQSQTTGERQVLMVLQSAPEVRELDGGNRTRHAAILVRV